MAAYYINTKNGQKYYYKDGKRISDEEGKSLGAKKNSVKSPSRRKSGTPARRRRSRSLKPCKSHQVRDPVTNRCKNKSGFKRPSSKKPSSKKPSSKKPSSKKPSSVKSPSRRKSGTPARRRRSRSFKPCKSHQVRDPVTNRCKNKSGIKRPSSKKPSSKKPSSKKPSSVKSTSRRKSPRKSSRNPVERVNKSERYKRINKIAGNCVKRSKLRLKDLQMKVVEYMENNDGLIVVHGTGCGKTLTAITTTQCYLDKYPDRGVVFVGPTSLISNFQKEMKAYGVKNTDRYEFYSYDKFMHEDKAGRAISLKNKFLVVDEAHNMRNPKGKKSIAVVKAAIKADKRLMLTATPFVNQITDFIPLINMVYGRMIVGTKKQFFQGTVDEMLGKGINDTNLATFTYLLKDKVDMVDCKDPKHFPERIDHYVDVEMSEKYYRDYADLVYGINLYNIVFTNPGKFYNGYRRAVNGAGAEYYSSKVEAALRILQKGHCIIYTNWIDFGIRPITEALLRNDISFQTFTGSTPTEERQGIIDAFNKNEFEVLILTKAGGEGIDLKGVRSVVVLDPTWNDAGLQQIIGRAIRYNSHAHLPLSKRKVDVYLMSLVPPSHIPKNESVPSGDKILYKIIDKKNEISTTLLALLGELSI